MKQQSTHESFAREEKISLGSERSFGIVMATAFVVFGVLNWYHQGHAWPWLSGIALLLLFSA